MILEIFWWLKLVREEEDGKREGDIDGESGGGRRDGRGLDG